jgi:hypothetical protein
MVVAASSLSEPGEVMVGDVRDLAIDDVVWHRITQIGERGMSFCSLDYYSHHLIVSIFSQRSHL